MSSNGYRFYHLLKNKTMMRFFINILVFLSVVYLPTYLGALVVVICIFMYENFIESIFWAYLIDVLYGGGKFFHFAFPYIFTLFIGVLYLSSFKLKKMLRF